MTADVTAELFAYSLACSSLQVPVLSTEAVAAQQCSLEVISSCRIAPAAASLLRGQNWSHDGLALWSSFALTTLAYAPLQPGLHLSLQLPLQVAMLDTEVGPAQQQRSTQVVTELGLLSPTSRVQMAPS